MNDSNVGHWEARIRADLREPDPVVRNLRITQAHYDLSLALRDCLGEDAGANFHTWAAWGSKKAGSTVRSEDAPRLRWAIPALGALAGAAVGAGVAHPPLAVPLGGAVGATLGAAILQTLLRVASRRILAGNETVLGDIGVATGRYLEAFPAGSEADPARLDAFLAAFEAAPSASGGQSLLCGAFREYDRARHRSDRTARHQHMLLGNYRAILHEHHRLQPYIAGAMPAPLRRAITARLLSFQLGDEALSVSRDVPSGPAAPAARPAMRDSAFPESLREISNPELRAFLTGPEGWDRTPDTPAGSRATDWTSLSDRMNYIVDLFRTRHLDPALFEPPYSESQRKVFTAGRRPGGPL